MAFSLQEIDDGDIRDGSEEESLLLQKVRAKCLIQLLLLSAIESLQVLDPLSFGRSAYGIVKTSRVARVVCFVSNWSLTGFEIYGFAETSLAEIGAITKNTSNGHVIFTGGVCSIVQ